MKHQNQRGRGFKFLKRILVKKEKEKSIVLSVLKKKK